MLNQNTDLLKTKQKQFWVLVISLLIISVVGGTAMASGSSSAEMSQVIESRTIDANGIEAHRVSSREGARIASEAAKRWQEKGNFSVDATKLHVYNLGTASQPDYLIASPGIDLGSASVSVARNGDMRFDGDFMSAGSEKTLTPNSPETTTYSYYQTSPFTALGYTSGRNGAVNIEWECLARENFIDGHGRGWMDTCVVTWKTTYRNRVHYQADSWGTAKSEVLSLREIRLMVEPKEYDRDFGWADWYPKGDTYLADYCEDYNVGGSLVVEVNVTLKQCDVWDITKYTSPGKFRNNWWSWDGAVGKERSVSLTSVIQSPEAKPNLIWRVTYGITVGNISPID